MSGIPVGYDTSTKTQNDQTELSLIAIVKAAGAASRPVVPDVTQFAANLEIAELGPAS
jgi:hypothetical protein